MENRDSYKVIGVMSGTSLDGLDIVLAIFQLRNNLWSFKIEEAKTEVYPETIVEQLKKGIRLTDSEIKDLDQTLGEFVGEAIKLSMGEKLSQIDFIASHGHTIFHQPEKGITLQIGSGEFIHQITKTPVVNDFRSLDVSLGGQGAPLVPVGDRDLFHEFDFCLNLGGIANISTKQNEEMIAFDICPFNMVLNSLAERRGLSYDADGRLASQGQIIPQLLQQLQAIPYNNELGPKSLGAEDYEKNWKPLVELSKNSPEDLMCTYCEYAAIEIAKAGSSVAEGSMLVTGGGAFHQHFIKRLKSHFRGQVIVPTEELISFKEALVFAYLGVLRVRDQPNCLSSVTGAKRNNSGGKLIGF
jgi:anhydro-N-acetylmuramic acid kinase